MVKTLRELALWALLGLFTRFWLQGSMTAELLIAFAVGLPHIATFYGIGIPRTVTRSEMPRWLGWLLWPSWSGLIITLISMSIGQIPIGMIAVALIASSLTLAPYVSFLARIPPIEPRTPNRLLLGLWAIATFAAVQLCRYAGAFVAVHWLHMGEGSVAVILIQAASPLLIGAWNVWRLRV